MTRLPTLGRRGEGWVALQAVLLGGVLLAGLAGMSGWTTAGWGGAARLASTAGGLVLAALGAFQVVRGTLDLGSNLSALPHPRDQAELVETGVYRRVRHPIYGGIILGAIGWGLATAAPIALGLALLLVPFFWLKSSVEERWCENRFPGYPAYRRRTRRFIAWPG